MLDFFPKMRTRGAESFTILTPVEVDEDTFLKGIFENGLDVAFRVLLNAKGKDKACQANGKGI